MAGAVLLGEDLSLYRDGLRAAPTEAAPLPPPEAELPYFDGRMVGRGLEVAADGTLVWAYHPRVPPVEGRLVGSILTIAPSSAIEWKQVNLDLAGAEEVIATDQIGASGSAGRGLINYGPDDVQTPGNGDLWIVTRTRIGDVVVVPPSQAPTLTAPATNATTSVPISWTAVTGATAYRVKVDNVDVQMVTVLSMTLTLAEGSHTIAVRGTNDGGDGPGSNVATTVVANQPPGPVTDLAVVASTPSTVQVTWSYTPPSDFSAFTVTSSPAGTAVVSGNGATISGLPADTNVTVSVSARDTGGLSSSVVSVTGRTAPQPPPQAPGAPTGLQATRIGYSSADFVWTAVAGADRYEVNGGGGWGNVGAATSFAWGGLNESTGYTLQVRAVNAGGAGAASQVGITTLPKVAYYQETYADHTYGYGAEGWDGASIGYAASGVLFTTDNWATGANSHLYALDLNVNTGPYSQQPDRWILFSLGINIKYYTQVTVWMGYPGTATWQAYQNGQGVTQQGAVAANAWPQSIGPNQTNNPAGQLNRLQITFGAGLGSPGWYKLREFNIGVRQVTGSSPVYNPA